MQYLAGRLSPEEAAAFEEFYLDNPGVVHEMEATARFQAGLAMLRETGELNRLLHRVPWYRRSHLLAIAASVAIFAFGAVLWRGSLQEPLPLLSTIAPPQDMAVRDENSYTILRTRTVGYDAEIRSPDRQTVLEFRILPERDSPTNRYRVSLARVGAGGMTHAVADIGPVTAAADGYLNLYADSAQLTPGRYRLAVSSDSRRGSQGSSFGDLPPSYFDIRITAASDSN